MKRVITAALAGATSLGLSFTLHMARAGAGEISGGIGSCDINSPVLGCTWKSKDCFKPDRPTTFVTDVDSYNLAVSEFNSYLREVSSFEDCVIAEAKHDVSENLPEIVAEGAKKEIAETDSEANEARSDLEIKRP
jgi:hypothetical protein